MEGENSVKILFQFFSEVFGRETTEILLAGPVNAEQGYYKLKSIPLYVPKIAKGDIVWAQYKEADKMLVYRTIAEPAGNSTIQAIILNEENNIGDIKAFFDRYGCATEMLNTKYFAVNIPADVDYFPIKRKLDELAKAKAINYVESHLSLHHYYINAFFK